MKRFILLAFLCLQVIIMSADIVKGRVVNADTNEPLEGAQVRRPHTSQHMVPTSTLRIQVEDRCLTRPQVCEDLWAILQ